MRKHFKYIIPSLLLVFSLTNCEDYLDVNDDPNNLTEVGLSSLLPAIEFRLADAQYSVSYQAAQATQQTASYFGYFENFRMGDAWSILYLRVLANADILARQAAAAQVPNYEGIAYAIQAYALSTVTDSWEAAPWSEAFDGSNNLEPVFDEQQELYATINTLLDKATPLLEYEVVDCDNEICVSAGSDLIYGGDMSKWLKMVSALRARMAIHLLNKGTANATAAINAANQAFTSNDDDFEFAYNDVERNPAHTGIALAVNTGNFTVAPGGYAVRLLNGELYNVADPRLEILFGNETEYIGIDSYDDDAPANTVDFSETTFHSREQTPMFMLTYAEMKFIEAEAQLALGQTGPAYTAYLAGIQASMDKYGVDPAAADAYLNDPVVAVGAAALTNELIMKEKYIALYFNYEVWTDMRRYNYSSNVYRNFVIPDTDRFGGPAQRALYPTDEFNRNGAEVSKVVRDFETQMWRDLN
ncbi:SusD/RagB family nutrient-binding outer membrane lipoprotein [Lewinella sp. LCG006]|uniref:SusD/RagB family nutrient-binding outer membrane lipoprotein n=1 Tax=Lewinella sp. LCG006 TaxID=3231911 RepID=UPI00345F8124